MSLDRELAEYTAKTSRSRALHEEALGVMPGGNSRTTTFFDPYPFYCQRGQGAHIWDADGTERIDFNNNYTSLVIGHAHPDVVKAVQSVAESGLSFPGPTEHEVRLAELLTRRIPSLQSVRFTTRAAFGWIAGSRRGRTCTSSPLVRAGMTAVPFAGGRTTGADSAVCSSGMAYSLVLRTATRSSRSSFRRTSSPLARAASTV